MTNQRNISKVSSSLLITLIVISGLAVAMVANPTHAVSTTLDSSNKTNCNATNSCSISITTSSQNDVVVVLCNCVSEDGIATFSMSGGGWTNRANALYRVSNTVHYYTEEWYSIFSSPVSSLPVTVTSSDTFPVGTYFQLVYFAVNGANLTSPFDLKTPVIVQAFCTSNNYPCGTITTPHVNDFVFHVVTARVLGYTTVPPSVGTCGSSSCTLLQEVENSGLDYTIQYLITSQSQSSATFQLGTSYLSSSNPNTEMSVLDAIVASGSGTGTTSSSSTTTTTSSTTTIPSTSTAPTATTAKNYNGHNTFFADTLYWQIYYDGTNMVCRTSSDTYTWSSPVTVFAQGADGVRDYWYDKGTNTLYYVRANSGEVGFHYRYGILSSAGCGSISWLIPETTQATIYPDTKYMGNIVLDSSGKMIVSLSTFDYTSGHWHLEVWKHLPTGWVNIKNLDVGTTEYGDILLPLTNSKLVLLSSYQPVDYVYGHIFITEYDGTGSWTSPTVTTSSYDGEFSSALTINDTVYFSGDDNLNPHNVKFWMCLYPCASTPPESIIFTSPTMNQDYQTNMASNGKAEIILNYATVKKGSSMDTISYVVSIDGGITFGPPLVQVTGENSIWNGFGSFNLVGNTQVCLMYTTGTASPYAIKYTCEKYYLGWLKP